MLTKPTVNDWCKGKRYPFPRVFALPGFVAMILARRQA